MAEAHNVSAVETTDERKARLVAEIKELARDLLVNSADVQGHSTDADLEVFQESVDALTVCAFLYATD